MSFLDEDNVKILQAMKEYGPRNLQEVARKSGVSYSTVYGRVVKLQTESALNTWINPSYSKIGLTRAMVLARVLPGREVLAREALKAPGYWLRIFRCNGEPNGYYSLHGVPVANQNDFHQYLDQLVTRGVMKDYQIFWLGESFSPLPNFQYYDPRRRTWRFEWKEWLSSIRTRKGAEKRQASRGGHVFDQKDLIILKELVKDARTTLADMSRILGMTLPATKYRFDQLQDSGYIEDYVITLLPFIPEVSDLCEITLHFRDEKSARNAQSSFSTMPFVVTVTPIKGLDSITIRTYIPRSEMNNLLSLIASLVTEGLLVGYSYITLDPSTQEGQTFAYKYYSDASGWRYDNREYLAKVGVLLAPSKAETEDRMTHTVPLQ